MKRLKCATCLAAAVSAKDSLLGALDVLLLRVSVCSLPVWRLASSFRGFRVCFMAASKGLNLKLQICATAEGVGVSCTLHVSGFLGSRILCSLELFKIQRVLRCLVSKPSSSFFFRSV